MTRFRIPRKTKKKLKVGLWLYPADENGNSLMAQPWYSQEDYDAVKQGIVENMRYRHKKSAREKFWQQLNKETFVPDSKLKSYVDGVFRKDLRWESYNTLLQAKKNPQAIIAYFNFINAYHLLAEGEDSYGNICCLAIDLAKDRLKGK